jgi:serine/threonine-protein kinase
MSDSFDAMIGQLVLGRYRIVQLLAQGGMGAVYLARVEGAAGFAKPVVVKRILPHLSDSNDDQQRFIQEAQILSNIRHPNIVNVIDFGKVEGAYLMVLEYVHGYHLGQWMKYVVGSRGKMPWEVSIYIMLQVLAALNYAHNHSRSGGPSKAIIHGDISPSNILIDVEGNVRLADFGIAHIEAEQPSRKGSVDGIFRGKLSYSSPERLSCENPTTLSDIYACGVLMYQMLAGTNPFNVQEPQDIISRVLALVPPPISSLRSDVPRELDGVLAKALAKKAHQRHTSALDFATELRAQLKRTETEVATETGSMIRADFNGDLAKVLGVHSLDALDAAWRRFSGHFAVPPLLSTPPTVNLRHMGRLVQQAENPIAPLVPTSTVLNQTVDNQTVDNPIAIGRGIRRPIVTVVVAALVAAGVAVAVALALRAPSHSSEPRYLVVESRNDVPEPRNLPEGTVQSSDGTTITPTPIASNTSLAPRAVKSTTTDSNRQGDPLSNLSRVFSKRQAAIQNCFRANALNVSGSPELSIRFSTDIQGNVISAAIRPEAVASTALGQCLAQVARTTTFGAQDKPLVFSIPITARVR